MYFDRALRKQLLNNYTSSTIDKQKHSICHIHRRYMYDHS
uniref:Uncharacterized protein n=1 Tax=Arundo donax TaxID=35708 RepID=A0A0A9GE71_ARUDO